MNLQALKDEFDADLASMSEEELQAALEKAGCTFIDVPCSDYVLRHFPKPCTPRKGHQCRICGSHIHKAEKCCRWACVEPGEGYMTSHAHPECYDVTKGWDDGDWESSFPGDMERPKKRMYWPDSKPASKEA